MLFFIRPYLFIILVGMFCSTSASAFVIDDNTVASNLSLSSSILEDNHYNIKQLINGSEPWKTVTTKKDLVYKYQTKPIWLKIPITNKHSSEENWIIHPTGYVKSLDVYIVNENGGYSYSRTG